MIRRIASANRLTKCCVLVVLLSLLLPFAVFVVWEHTLLSGAHSQQAGQELSDTARGNNVACLLYDCARILNVDVSCSGFNPDENWTTVEMQSTYNDRARSTLFTLNRVGVLDKADYEQGIALCLSEDTTWTAKTAPGGLLHLEGYVANPDSFDTVLTLSLSSDNLPLYFSFVCPAGTQAEKPAAEKLAAYKAHLGLDSFADFESVSWDDGANSSTDETAMEYSPDAQTVLSVTESDDSIYCSAINMTPKTYAYLTAQDSTE